MPRIRHRAFLLLSDHHHDDAAKCARRRALNAGFPLGCPPHANSPKDRRLERGPTELLAEMPTALSIVSRMVGDAEDAATVNFNRR